MTVAARTILHHLQGIVPVADGGLLILAYHLVDGGTTSPVDLPIATFERQMEELTERVHVLHLEEAVDHLEQGDLPAGLCAVVTFDDGYRNFLSRAWPVLERYGIPSTLFVPVGFLDQHIPPPIRGTQDLAPLSWKELADLAAHPLVSVGSHTRTHPDLRRLDRPRLHDEIRGSKEDLEERLGTVVNSFCYPRAQWSRAAERIVAECYRCGLVAGGRKVRAGALRLARLSRLPMRRDMPTSLEPVLSSAFWLEEYIADTWRRWIA